MNDRRAAGTRSALASVAFLAKLVAVFSLFAVVGSLLATGVPDSRALLALVVSLAFVVGADLVSGRE